MHHVPPDDLEGFMGEMHRVTKKGGLVVVFEHNPLNPLTRHAVDRCTLDEDAILLGRSQIRGLFSRAGIEAMESRYLFFTPFAGGFFQKLDRALGWLPLGAQYYVAGWK
jgi:hypothetical protein